jgi:hypothetical protein
MLSSTGSRLRKHNSTRKKSSWSSLAPVDGRASGRGGGERARVTVVCMALLCLKKRAPAKRCYCVEAVCNSTALIHY